MNDIDVLQRFDWGNRKIMPLQRFMKEYNRLSKEEQTKVLSSLKDGSNRKKSILRHLRQQAEQAMKNRIKADIECIAEYLSGYTEGDIKTQDEAALAIAIISNNFYLDPHVEEKDSNDRSQINSFLGAKNKMLEWIVRIDERVGHNPGNNKLYDLLNDFIYVPEQSKDSLLQNKKRGWFNAYRSIGTGIVRAKSIKIGLSKLLSDKENLSKATVFTKDKRSISLDNPTIINESSFKERCKTIDSIQDIDEYTKMKLRLHALRYFVSDDMQNLGKELLKVYGGTENYSLSFDDICAKNYDDMMTKEKTIFAKYNHAMPKEIEESIKETYNLVN